ncbi:MAG: dTDP-4-dehydrorhamnose reductase [Betaproteobacteria bacterium]|nr:dTDP-4-dehydrorhamnose reductase [Betaproteobacteria bacterium]
MTRILLTGKTGQVGGELITALAPLGEVMACDRDALDLADPAAMVATVRKLRPDIIVNAAAYTAVDRAEAEPALAIAVNGTAPGILAAEALRLNALLVHYSTDYVFDGTKRGSYSEDDAPAPLNVYGRTKLAGERAVQTSGARHLILRTSWVYGARGNNFLITMSRLAAERDELKVVDDQIGAPTWCRDIATATGVILARLQDKDGARNGIYNLSAQGSTSWHGFAAEILAHAAAKPKARLLPIPTSAYPSAAARPLNSVLSHDKVKNTFGIDLPDWRASLAACLASK